MTYKELIEASGGIVKKATKGPWEARWRTQNLTTICSDGESLGDMSTWWAGIPGSDDTTKANAAFIAHARTALPLALQGLEDALRVVEAARRCAPEDAVAALREIAKTSNDPELLEMLALGDAVAEFDKREAEL